MGIFARQGKGREISLNGRSRLRERPFFLGVNVLDKILTEMKQQGSSKPKPLGGGLTIRLVIHEAGLFELRAWREKKLPSDLEIGTLINTIKMVDDPVLVFRTIQPEESDDGRFFAYRIWWVTGGVMISWLRPAQAALPVLLPMEPAAGEGAFS